MRVFLVPQVAKLMRKERLPEAALCRTAREVLAGALGAGEADLGGGLFKKRVARPDGGKSGGYRMVVAYRQPRHGEGSVHVRLREERSLNADTTGARGTGEGRGGVPDRRRWAGRDAADFR